MVRLHIDEVCPKSNTYPLIVNFENGLPTESFKPNSCLLFDNKKTGLKTVTTVIDGILYAGDEVHNEETKTFIVRRNKKSGKVRILETGSINLKPVFSDETAIDTAPETINNKLELSRKFGSKKQKKRMEQREKLKVNEETVAEQMESATKEVSNDTLDLSVYNKSDTEDFYIPTINRSAIKASDVYNIDDILNEEEYATIISELEEKNFIDDLLPWIQSTISKKSLSKKRLVLAVYANYLLNIFNTSAKVMAYKTFCICPCSSTLNDIILKNFTIMSPNSRRARPTPYKDKALCHAIVFLLLINDLKFELDSLCEVIKISLNTAVQKTKVTGATVIMEGSKKVVQLKIPLIKQTILRRKSAKF